MTAIRLQVKCEATAEDICQETFEKVFKHVKTYDVVKGKFNTWIVTIAKNIIIDHYRREGETSTRYINVDNFVHDGNRSTVDNFVHDGNRSTNTNNFFIEPQTTDRELENNELKQKITKVFSTLKPKHKEIAVMYFKQNLQYTDIANVLEIPLNTVKVTIMRIREVLQSQLKKEYELING
jgi:RNA polymerase sigma-70 factor (ECF subfamily)